MACACADCTTFETFVVIRGEDIPYRLMDVENEWKSEYVHDYLPSGPLVSVRQDNAFVDRHVFAQWSKRFVEHVKAKTKGGL